MRFNFDLQKVLPMMEHAKATKPAAIVNDLFDARLLKPGCSFGAAGYAKAEDVDTTKIPARLVLVNDAGVYLMCSTEPELLDAEGRCNVVYAKGYTAEEGGADGDDFAETIEVDAIERMVEGFKDARKQPGMPASMPTLLAVELTANLMEVIVA
ncbi:hypothetical protein AB7849_15145 [Rhodanobacter sp. 115]|uniref:hypothetical protein n=1 Tax=Rhodanobacter sp. FW021-MT20 TaxID=1162282 RepID=UPI0034E60E5B